MTELNLFKTIQVSAMAIRAGASPTRGIASPFSRVIVFVS